MVSLEQLLEGARRHLGDGKQVSPLAVLAGAVLPLLLFLLKPVLFPTFDPREPPVLRPGIPFFGHLISMIREQGNFLNRL